MSATKGTRKSAASRAGNASSGLTGNASSGLTEDERATIREYAKEAKTARRSGPRSGEAAEAEVLAKIAEMPEHDRAIAQRLHAIIKASAPVLSPRTWYGMPAYAKGGNVVCFFQPSQKFKTRYSTLGFSDKANLDNGTMWPSSFALVELTPGDEVNVAALVKKATS